MTPLVSTNFGWRQTLAALALVSLLAGFAAGVEPPAAYRRILVPADSPATWPREGDTFLPIEARDFDAWVATANEPPAAASIVEAQYEARLVESELVDGRGRWQVVLRGEGPARLPVGDTPLVLRDAQWRGEAIAPARLGWWPTGDGGRLSYALEVPRSGELEFFWRAKPMPSAATALEFPLRLPVAARMRLILDLPAGRRPVISGGVVLQAPAVPDEGGRWVLAVGASAAGVLRIENTNRAATPQAFATSVREELRYELSERGLELEAKLRLAANGAAVPELRVSLPAGLQLISAATGERSLKWRVTAGEDGSAPRAVIRLPTPPPDGPMTVTLRAWGPLVQGESLRLPMLAVDDAFWTSGALEIVLEDSLELRELTPIDCVQSGVEAGAPADDRRRSLQFAAFSPSATVEVSLDHRPERGSVRMGAALEVGNSGVVGRLVAEVSVGRGSLHKLTAELQPGWSIDAVETVPADALGEWYIDRARNVQTVELQLNRAVTSDQPVTIVVTGRLQRAAAAEPLPLADLSPLDWRGLSVERNLLQLRAAEQHELETVGELQYVAADTLTAAERQLLATPAEGRICDFAANSPPAAIRLAPNKGTFDAAIQLDATLTQGRLRQTYRVDCRPQGSGIDHVLVYLSAPASEPLRWTDAESHEPLVAERMPASDPRLGGLPPGGELWRLHLRRLYARPLAITATRSAAWPQRQRVPFVSLPDAATQQGRVTVSSAGAELPTIVAQGMSPAPLPFESPGGAPPGLPVATRAVYRFQPTRFHDAGPAPELWLGPAVAADDTAKLLATRIAVESHFSADGSGVHRATYHLENQGANAVELSLPEGVRLEAARVDGQPVASPQPDKIAIPLSSRPSNAVLELDLTSRNPPLVNGCRLPSPLPTGRLTILDGKWTVLVPHGFAAFGDAAVSAGTTFDWRERLFGPLARPRSVRPFNPFAARDWNTLWAGMSRGATTPAQAAAISGQVEPPMPTGWHSYQVDFVAAPPGPITVVDRPATTAGALAIFLGCAVGATLCGVRVFALVILSMAAAAMSLFLPVAYAPFATAATLGLLAAALWQWLQRLIGASRPTLLIAVAALVISSAAAHAAPPPAAVERVLVPVDSDGKTVGSKYFVSAKFFRRLMGSSGGQSANGGAWLLTDMRCDGELVPRQDQAGLRTGNWSLTLEIDVLARDTTIHLPLVQRDAEWPAAASLDGMPAPIEWDALGRSCSVRVAEPGHRRLSILFEPHIKEVSGRRQFALSLPPITGATVRIVCPASLAELRGGDADFSRHDELNRTIWQGELDSSGRLTASWTANLAGMAAAANRRVDELLWLHVRPDGLALDARFTLPSGAGWPDSIAVAVDDRWELLAGDVAAPADDAEISPDGRRLLQVRTPSATDEDRQILLRFRARDASPLGRLRLPAMGLTSSRAENRWLAVSCDPRLECVPSAAATASPPTDFANAWGTADEPAPQIFVDAAGLDAAWYLAIRPRVGISTCRDRLSLAAGQERLRVDYRSDVTPEGADCFGWSLAVPATLVVDRVAVASAGKSIPLDWVRVAPNRLNLFFAEAVSTPYRLQLQGSLPVTPDGRVPLPRITPAGSQRATQTVALYRDEDVLARWHFSGDAPWVESGASQSPPFDRETHFVRAYSVDSLADDAVQILVESNQPAVRGDTLTTVSRESGNWAATFTCDLRVERGELDVLRLQIPANWNGPFEVTPAAKTRLRASGISGERATLSIRLPRSARPGDAVTMQLRSPLALADAELPAAPQIVLLAAGKRQNFLSLPASLDGERAAWTRGGVEPAELPRALRPASSDADRAETFRIVADAINVTLRPRPTRASSASVRLAETAVHLGPLGGKFAVTRFIVAPEGLTQCVVALPQGERLVRATLDGHPALVRSLDPSRWQVQLGPPNLPQTLDVVSRSVDRSDQPSSRPVEISRPVLEQSGQPIPVDLGLWTLSGVVPGATPRVTGGALVTPAELAATRLERLASISQSATRSVVESPVVDGFSWFAHWTMGLEAAERVAGSLQRSSAGAQEAIRVPQPADNSVSESIARCDAWIEQIAEIFAATGLAISPPERPAAAFDPWQPWPDVASESLDRVCFISDGGQDRVLVELVPDGVTATEARLAALASLAAAALVAVWLIRTPAALQFAESWPETVGIVLGLAAWAWLRPSAVGLLIVAASLSWLARRLYRDRKSPGHDSSNQPSSIPEEVA